MTVSLLRHNSNYGGYSQAKQRRKVFFKTARHTQFRQWFSLKHDTGVFRVPLKTAKTQSFYNDSAKNTVLQVRHVPGHAFTGPAFSGPAFSAPPHRTVLIIARLLPPDNHRSSDNVYQRRERSVCSNRVVTHKRHMFVYTWHKYMGLNCPVHTVYS